MNAQDIRTHAADALAVSDWEAVAKVMNTPSIKQADNTLRSTSWLMQQLTAVVDPATGATEADIILGTLQKATIPRVRAAYDRMSSVGIDLSDDQVQVMLPVLSAAGNWPAGLVEKIMETGIQIVSPAGEVVTAEQCQKVMIFDAGREAEQVIRSRLSTVTAQMDNLQNVDSETMTVVEYQAAVDAIVGA